MDGLTCAQKIREDEKRKGSKEPYWIVGCTGNARAQVSWQIARDGWNAMGHVLNNVCLLCLQQVDVALEAGMNTVITKPCEWASYGNPYGDQTALTECVDASF